MYFNNINKKQLKKMINDKEEIFLLDVRTKEEYEEINIDTSFNMPVTDLFYNIDDLEDLKNKKVVVYCRSGHRSVAACNLLYMEGFRNLYNLDNGILDYFLD